MPRKNLLLFLFLVASAPLFSQTNVRAWYADGQVWVVWEAEFPLPDWYAVYAKPTAFASTTDAIRLGKLHKFEYSCIALKEQVDTAATPRIPSPTGVGKYQLQFNEALFVFTPHQPGALFFAVVADDETAVIAGQNITASAVSFDYEPVNDPVECHLQALFPSPFAAGYTCMAFLMWADGRQNQWENRPDFPVMANAAKNGMPGFFLISFPNDIDTTQPFPLSVWLHGGGGTARQSLAGSRAEVNIKPEQGILLAHNDDMMGWRDQVPPNPEQPTWHFGWRKNYDPFTTDNLPTAPDTIVNYTQRRYLWIDSWLIRNYNIDPGRIHIHGHSMGSAGSTAMAKCYPTHYASATIFNNGFGPHEAQRHQRLIRRSGNGFSDQPDQPQWRDGLPQPGMEPDRQLLREARSPAFPPLAQQKRRQRHHALGCLCDRKLPHSRLAWHRHPTDVERTQPRHGYRPRLQ
ncbi:MAG: hypothetical protein IPN33_16380 [Saprospiraceae bacterium]|nr:hypothetical protein [Saprospiraceae bacterium]